jgi:hypothetical protein
MEFKIGDTIKCVDANNYEGVLTVYKLYTIIGFDGKFVAFIGDDHREHLCFYWRFKKINNGRELKKIKPFGIVNFCKKYYEI